MIAGALTAIEPVTAYFVLAVGWTACSALALATYRCYSVVRPIIDELKRDKTTALSWASEAARHGVLPFSANHVIGWVVPAFCSTTLILAIVGLACNLWKPTQPRHSARWGVPGKVVRLPQQPGSWGCCANPLKIGSLCGGQSLAN